MKRKGPETVLLPAQILRWRANEWFRADSLVAAAIAEAWKQRGKEFSLIKIGNLSQLVARYLRDAKQLTLLVARHKRDADRFRASYFKQGRAKFPHGIVVEPAESISFLQLTLEKLVSQDALPTVARQVWEFDPAKLLSWLRKNPEALAALVKNFALLVEPEGPRVKLPGAAKVRAAKKPKKKAA
jgi:hypothetical protein